MKKAFLLLLGSLLTAVIMILSCKKETSCENCKENEDNKPPIAIAGPDQTIILPTDSVFLDAGTSTDPDGSINNYLWTKISGPVSSNIIKPSDSVTKVKSLFTGSYLFELKVTDNGGLSARDTMQVFVNSTTNHPPIANAGNDTTIIFPANTINLDGSRSTDPENNIVSYIWSKISGPSSFNITSSSTVQTQVTNLGAGIYQFELKVVDAGGVFSKDTMQVSVNPITSSSCNIPLVSVGTLSISRFQVCAATAGDKILFAGGYTGSPSFIPSSRVDIYNMTTQSWSTAELSTPGVIIGKAVTVGNKIFFGGDGTSNSSRFDIYDASTNTWSTAPMSLSVPRAGYTMESTNGKIVFAGGFDPYSTVVDIYDVVLNTWSINNLSEPRVLMSSTSIGNKIYFSGGFGMYTGGVSNYIGSLSNEVNIYDASTNGWSTIYMTVPRWSHGSISADNKIFWFGGDSRFDSNGESVSTDTTEIYDINTGNRSYHRPTGHVAATKNNKVLFFSGSYQLITPVEIYTMDTQSWSHCEIVNPTPFTLWSVVTTGNNIYIERNSEILRLIY